MRRRSKDRTADVEASSVASRSTGSSSRSRPARRSSRRPRPPAAGSRPLCFDDRQAPFGACRVCLVGGRGLAQADPRLHDPLPRRDGDRDRGADRPPRRRAPWSSSSSPSCRSRPPPHTELAAGRRAPRRRWLALERAPSHPHEDDFRHPYLALQHELCISCGRCVRACDEIQGAFALTATGRGFEANIAAGLDAGLRGLELRLLRRLRRHLPHRRDLRDQPGGTIGGEVEMATATTPEAPASGGSIRPRRDDDLRLLRGRLPTRDPRPRRARRLDRPGRSTAPPTRATPA